MSKYFLSGMSIVLALCFFFHAPFVQAGGSSFAVRTSGKTAFVKSNQAIPSLLSLHLETYFGPAYWTVHSLRIDQVTIECRGDDVMKNASIRLGSKVYGSGAFKRMPHAGQVFQAILHPKDLVLLNDSFYGVQIDAAVKPSTYSFRTAFCLVGGLEFSASMDGKNFVDSLSLNGMTYDVNGFSYQEKPVASAVIVGDLKRFQTSPTGASFDLNPSLSGTVLGTVMRTPTGHDQLNLGTWDKEVMDDLMSQHHIQLGSLFDLAPLTAAQREQSDQALRWRVNQVHFYPVPSADGAVGMMVLGTENLN
jgi:hypothetical protein